MRAYLLVFELCRRSLPTRMTYAHVCVLCRSLTEAKGRAVERCWRDQFEVKRIVSFAVTINGLESGLLPMERELVAKARVHRQRVSVLYRDSLHGAAQMPPPIESLAGKERGAGRESA